MKIFIFRKIALFSVYNKWLWLLKWVVDKNIIDIGFYESYLLRNCLWGKNPAYKIFEYLLTLPEIDPNCVEGLPIRTAWKRADSWLMKPLLKHPKISTLDLIIQIETHPYFYRDVYQEYPGFVISTDIMMNKYLNRRLPLGFDNNSFLRKEISRLDYINAKPWSDDTDKYRITILERNISYLLDNPDVSETIDKSDSNYLKKLLKENRKKNRKKRIKNLDI